MQVKLTPLRHNDDRLVARRLVRLRARFEGANAGAGTVDAFVVDLSEKGCRLEGAPSLEEGDAFLIKLPGLEAKACHVVWTRGEQAGCEFDTPLYRAERELVHAQKAPAGKVRTGVFGRPAPGHGPGRKW